MRRRKLLYGLGASGAVLVPSGLTAAAYNSFTVDREATIDVATDQNGLLGLTPGASQLVTTQNEKLRIDINTLAGSEANGQNRDSELVVGDSANPTTTFAFSFTNNSDAARDINVGYTFDSSTGGPASDPAGSTTNLSFEVYDDSGTSVGTATEGTDLGLTSVAAGATHYVVMVINTENVSSSTALTGLLSMSMV